MKRLLTSSSDGPWVFIEADHDGVAFLKRVAAHLRDDVAQLGLRALTVAAPPQGFTVRCAARLQAGDDAGWVRRCDPPFNDETRMLLGYRLHEVTVTARTTSTTVWFLLIDDSDATHLPEYIRSDNLDLSDFV